MKTITITPNLLQFTRLYAINAFLVREDDGFTLVDTTIGGSADRLIAAAHHAGGEIRRIALTHGHGDHVGSLDALTERLGRDVEVLMGELDVRLHAGERISEGKPKGSWPKLKTSSFNEAIARAARSAGSWAQPATPYTTKAVETASRSLTAKR